MVKTNHAQICSTLLEVLLKFLKKVVNVTASDRELLVYETGLRSYFMQKVIALYRFFYDSYYRLLELYATKITPFKLHIVINS